MEQVDKSFGSVRAVQGLDLTVPAGCIYGVLGPNGAGKTTAIRMLMDIVAPDHGRIEMLGAATASSVKDRVGYLPEERGLYRKMRVADTLRYLGQIKGVPARVLREAIPARLEAIGLASWASHRVDELSKGMQQKIQFLGAVISDPELVILDEPFAGLDPINLEALTQQILQMRAGGGTILLSTHMMEQAQRLCDSVVLIHKGRKVLDGPVREILSRVDPRIVLVEIDGDETGLPEFAMVEQVERHNGGWQCTLAEGTDPQAFLAALAGRCRVLRFEVKRPTLTEVFLASVSDATDPAAMAAGQEVAR
ncbi:MAG: ATP-binding cassette domain-containing protein [Phycisphaerae bacterium]|nr:ATP-binding cassette domain-containing protein [Phycisphaerae bacterium]